MSTRRLFEIIRGGFRDVQRAVESRAVRSGKNLIAVIGIDRYTRWPRLNNAVHDARGALAAFEHLGFEPLLPPLLDEVATSDAIRRLVSDRLAQLGTNDNLVLFFAGHGYTSVQTFDDGDSVKTGYIIPVDGDLPGHSTAHWLRLDTWLSDVARLAARHILVVLDACHSGIAVGSLRRYRGVSTSSASFDRLVHRRSRKVITSAQDDQRALDSGPRRGHSLFTGYLLDGLDGGLGPPGTRITGSEIGFYLQRKVTAWPDAIQTPDFGVLEEDRSGELVICLRPVVPDIACVAPPPAAPAADMPAWTTADEPRATKLPSVLLSLPIEKHAHIEDYGVAISSASRSGMGIAVNHSILPHSRNALVIVLCLAGVTSIAVTASILLRLNDGAPEHSGTEFGEVLSEDNPWRAITSGPAISSKQITVGEYIKYLTWVSDAPGRGPVMERPAGMPRETAHLTNAERAQPLGNVTFEQADAFCVQAGGRLLTIAEWHLIGFGHGDIENWDGTVGPLREWTRVDDAHAKVCGTNRQLHPEDTTRHRIDCVSEKPAPDIGFRCARTL